MGEHDVGRANDPRQQQAFTRALLDEVRILERMIEEGCLETDVRRIGAEQEMFLVDAGCAPAPVAIEVLDALKDPRLTTELARFNLEANLPAYVFEGDCLRRMEDELHDVLNVVRTGAATVGADVVLTGILPTLQLEHLGLDNMAPVPRYYALNDAMVQHRGGDFHVRIKGTDELDVEHDNVMLEACNTSFQVHFQVAPHEFAALYNAAQAVTAPVLAAAVNSPLLLGQRLWHETRVALFQSSIDDRSNTHRARGRRPRVRFGDAWIEESVLEIFREDIARYRVLVAIETEDERGALDAGQVPQLRALRLHNGTVYRWNRACYGTTDGVPHLRIENRVLPAGPTVIDQVGNSALFYGLMAAVSDAYGDIRDVISFDDAKSNFVAAARLGLKAQLTWFNGQTSSASRLLLDHLIPLARQGLASRGIDAADIERYLGTVEERVRAEQTGAQWALDSLAGMQGGTPYDRLRTLTKATLTRQRTEEPVARWSPARLGEAIDWRRSYDRVGQFMKTDLYTVRPEDLVDLAANVMDWASVRHVPVEDDEGRLAGMVSHRTLLRLLIEGRGESDGPVAVIDLMDPVEHTVSPETTTLEALRTMRADGIDCLPVIRGDRLVGLVTEKDLFDVAARVLEEQLGLDEGS